MGSHVGRCGKVVPVIVEFIRHIPTLSSEDHEATRGLITKLDEIYSLRLCDDIAFFFRKLFLISGVVFRFFREYLQNDRSLEQCKCELLKEFYPHFISERMISVHELFNFLKRLNLYATMSLECLSQQIF